LKKEDNILEVTNILLEGTNKKFKSVFIDKLGKGVLGECTIGKNYPFICNLYIDNFHFEDFDPDFILETIIHECHHCCYMDQYCNFSINNELFINLAQFNNFFESGAYSCNIITMNAIKNKDKIYELIRSLDIKD